MNNHSFFGFFFAFRQKKTKRSLRFVSQYLAAKASPLVHCPEALAQQWLTPTSDPSVRYYRLKR